MNTPARSLVLSLLLVFFPAFWITAQDLDDVTIAGRVVDSNRLPIVGATIVATHFESRTERTVTADEEGRYRFIKLRPGLYKVRTTAHGFDPKETLDLQTISGQNVQLDITLAPAGVTASVTVTASEDEVSSVDTTRTVVGGTVTQLEIEELPNTARNPLDLVFTLGGISEEPLSVRDAAEDRARPTGDSNND